MGCPKIVLFWPLRGRWRLSEVGQVHVFQPEQNTNGKIVPENFNVLIKTLTIAISKKALI